MSDMPYTKEPELASQIREHLPGRNLTPKEAGARAITAVELLDDSSKHARNKVAQVVQNLLDNPTDAQARYAASILVNKLRGG